MQGKKRQFIFGLIGLGCGIVLSGILNLLLLLNTTEYKNGITLNAGLMTQSILKDESKSEAASLSENKEATRDENIQSKKAENKKADESVTADKNLVAENEQVNNAGVNVTANTSVNKEVTVTIPPKMTASDTCEILEAAGVIDDAKDFKNYISERKKTTKLNEGTFVLSKNMSYNELLDKLMID